jgi:hypothetical protein
MRKFFTYIGTLSALANIGYVGNVTAEPKPALNFYLQNCSCVLEPSGCAESRNFTMPISPIIPMAPIAGFVTSSSSFFATDLLQFAAMIHAATIFTSQIQNRYPIEFIPGIETVHLDIDPPQLMLNFSLRQHSPDWYRESMASRTYQQR